MRPTKSVWGSSIYPAAMRTKGDTQIVLVAKLPTDATDFHGFDPYEIEIFKRVVGFQKILLTLRCRPPRTPRQLGEVLRTEPRSGVKRSGM